MQFIMYHQLDFTCNIIVSCNHVHLSHFIVITVSEGRVPSLLLYEVTQMTVVTGEVVEE